MKTQEKKLRERELLRSIRSGSEIISKRQTKN